MESSSLEGNLHWLDQLNLIVNQYDTLITVSVTVMGALLAAIFGKRAVLWIINRLLSDRDSAEREIKRLREQLADAKRKLRKTNSELKVASGKLSRARDGFSSDEKDLWLREPFDKPENYHANVHNSIPIILVANLKGGVGKTTTAANLVGYFEDEHHERVLAIDLDYQGSLSSMLLDDPRNRHGAPAKNLIGGDINADTLLSDSDQVAGTNTDSRLIQCQFSFANFETKMALSWLIEDIPSDVRYHLANILFSDNIQDAFDRIIIDAPPRVTTGFINGLCASTHVLIPTILDQLSVDAVGTFLQDIKRMKGQLFPELKTVGVVGTMKATNTDTLRQSEENAIRELKNLVREELGSEDKFLENTLIPRTEQLAVHAGMGMAYRESSAVRNAFLPLGTELYARTTPNSHRATYHASQSFHHATEPV